MLLVIFLRSVQYKKISQTDIAKFQLSLHVILLKFPCTTTIAPVKIK